MRDSQMKSCWVATVGFESCGSVVTNVPRHRAIVALDRRTHNHALGMWQSIHGSQRTDALTRITGYEPDVLDGAGWLELVSARDRERSRAEFDKVLAGQVRSLDDRRYG